MPVCLLAGRQSARIYDKAQRRRRLPASSFTVRLRGAATVPVMPLTAAFLPEVSHSPGMTIATKRPLGAYITERELPRTPEGRLFELLLPYQLEASEKATVFRWRWMYTDTQRSIDAGCGITNGHRTRHALEKQAFIRQILRELRQKGERLYSLDGQKIPVRGKG
jgi:hypothetical protein